MPESPRQDLMEKQARRIEYLEKTAQWNLFCFELLVSLGELHHSASIERSPYKIFKIAGEHLIQVVPFAAMGFYLVDEYDSEFVLEYVWPDNKKIDIAKEVERYIQDGTFAWALNQNRPVFVKNVEQGRTYVFHVLANKRRINGMYVGVMEKVISRLDEMVMHPLSIILQNTANGLESIYVYELMRDYNKKLESKVQERTQELQGNMARLQEEVAFRKVAEESLWIAKSEAEEANRIKNDFLANISHEFRTPLNAILGYSEMLQFELEKLDRPDLLKDLNTVEIAGKHLLNLVNDILDMSKIQAGKMNISLEPVSVSSLVGEIVETLYHVAKKNKNDIKLVNNSQSEIMNSDPTRLRQILLNIVGNACKFTKNGLITVKTEIERTGNEEYIIFEVTDTGIGIDPAEVERLFQSFTQSDSSRTRKYGGTGLGLPISKKLCQLLGGDIEVFSDVNEGSTFRIRLPLDSSRYVDLDDSIHAKNHSPIEPRNIDGFGESKENSEEMEVAKEKGSPDGQDCNGCGERAILVGNDLSSIKLLSRFLNRLNITTFIEHQAVDLADKIQKLETGMVFIEYDNYENNNHEFIESLVNDPLINNVDFILIAESEVRKGQIPIGVSGIIRKPIDFNQISQLLARLGSSQERVPVLVLGDDANSREFLCTLLKQEGLDAFGISYMDISREMISRRKPGLVIMDLPGSGNEHSMNIVELHEKYLPENIPIVIFTAKDIGEQERFTLEKIAVRILQKGCCTRGELVNEVRNLVRSIQQPVNQEGSKV